MRLANPTVQVNHFYFQKECVYVAFSISSLLAPRLGTSCQTQRFKLAQSCPLSWDLQRQMLSAYAEAARPQQGSGLQLCQSREVWKTPQRTEELVFLQTTGLFYDYNIYDFGAFVIHWVFILIPHCFSHQAGHSHLQQKDTMYFNEIARATKGTVSLMMIIKKENLDTLHWIITFQKERWNYLDLMY